MGRSHLKTKNPSPKPFPTHKKLATSHSVASIWLRLPSYVAVLIRDLPCNTPCGMILERGGDVMEGVYRTAQICLNGHCITESVDAYPVHAQSFCDKCGAPTITTCPACNASIRGYYFVPGFVTVGHNYEVPSYCYSCGKPYPWTDAAIMAATELINEEEDLDEVQRSKLISSLPDIMTETPKTQVAITRFKKALMAVGEVTADALRQFVIDFGCKLAMKQLGL